MASKIMVSLTFLTEMSFILQLGSIVKELKMVKHCMIFLFKSGNIYKVLIFNKIDKFEGQIRALIKYLSK